MKGRNFFYIRNADGVITGPFPSRKIQEMRDAGRIRPDCFLSRDGVTWERVDSPRRNEQATLPDADGKTLWGHLPAPPIPEPMHRGAGYCDGQDSSGNFQENGHDRNCLGYVGSDAGNGSGYPGEDSENDGENHEDASGLALWSRILWFSWEGARHFQTLSKHAQSVCRWVLPYSLAACVAPWLIFPPEKTLFSSGHLLGFLIGMASWGFILLLSLLSPLLLSWFSGMRFRLENEEMLASLHIACVSSVFYGNSILFRQCLLMPGMPLWTSAGILGVLLVWCVGMQSRMVWRLNKERRQAARRHWIPSCLVPLVLFLEMTIIILFIFGGFK